MLPQFNTDDRPLSLMQNAWATKLNPLLDHPFFNGHILEKVSLGTGSNVVNHLLNRKLLGWVIVRRRANATVYDTQDTNALPDKTLTLVASTNVVVDIFVF
jgi:hypothetical protein